MSYSTNVDNIMIIYIEYFWLQKVHYEYNYQTDDMFLLDRVRDFHCSFGVNLHPRSARSFVLGPILDGSEKALDISHGRNCSCILSLSVASPSLSSSSSRGENQWAQH